MKKIIVDLIKDVLKKQRVEMSEEEIASFIEIPQNYEKGDYAFPCFYLANKLKMSPNEIACELRKDIKKIPDGLEDITAEGAYLNFFVDRKELTRNLMENILSLGERYGSGNIGEGKNALIEHTSINPNASPHVGRTRNALIGDSLVRIFKFLNYKPEVHYYVNDVSKQIAMLVVAKAEKLKFENMLEKYIKIAGKVEKSKKIEKEVFKILERFEQKDKAVVYKFKKITNTCVKGQLKILSQLGIKYDIFDYESGYLDKSKEILKELEKTGRLEKDEENRLVLNLEGTGIEKQMRSPILVLTRSDGTGLYPLRDLAYTIEKLKISKKNMIVLGEDQKLYFQQIKEALKLLGFEAPEVIHYSYILLSDSGKIKKMSTRKGDVVLLEDFLRDAVKKARKEINKRKTKGDPKKVGVSAVKYAILKNNNNKVIRFNLDEALSFEGDTGPYLLYSYARASSIIRKSKIKLNKNIKLEDIGELEDKEIELIKKISEFPDIVNKAYKHLNPSLIANYSYQLAQIFNEFYHSCPVIDSDKIEFRIALVYGFRQVLKNSLNLLGIETLEEM